MEPNLWLAIINALGFQAVVLAVVFNWNTWKADLLFLVSFAFVCVRLYYYIRQKDQAVRRENLEYRKEQQDLERKNDNDTFY